MKTKWHDINKQLPKEDKDYLVCDRNGVMFVAMYTSHLDRWIINGAPDIYGIGMIFSDEGYFRFWSELPDEPEGLSY